LFQSISFQLKTPLVLFEESLDFEFNFTLKKKCNVRLEYALYFLKKNGSYTRKVFKIAEKEMAKGHHECFKKSTLEFTMRVFTLWN
jgi:hypothetical protein